MSNKKKQQFSQKRLRELEKQLEEYTDEDYLNEADELEKEMLEGDINFDIPDDFFQQILAKGKLIEAEKERNKQKNVGQEADKEAEIKIKRVWDASVSQDAEPVDIAVTTSLPTAELSVENGNVAGKSEAKPELPQIPEVLAAVEITAEQETVRADVSNADEVKAEGPVAAVQKKQAAVEENNEQSSEQGEKKPRRGVKLRWKVLLTVMILVMVPLAVGITSGGKKHYKFEVQEQHDGKGQRISFSNDGFTEDIIDEEMIAYDEIEKQIGIDAIKIGDRPSDLFYDSYVITGHRADILFSCDNKYLTLTEIISNEKTKADYINDAEREKASSVYNEHLEIKVNIYKEKVKSNEIKYHAVIVTDTSIYKVTATISLEDFEKILIDLYF